VTAGFGIAGAGDTEDVGNRILVVVTSKVDTGRLDAAMSERFPEAKEVRVLAPASGLSRLDWLATADDGARADATELAVEAADAIPTTNVSAEVGDTDPMLAIDDALRTFPADEIVIVTGQDDQASWLEVDAAGSARERFDVPVTHLIVG
jgi:hypothetical protein